MIKLAKNVMEEVAQIVPSVMQLKAEKDQMLKENVLVLLDFSIIMIFVVKILAKLAIIIALV